MVRWRWVRAATCWIILTGALAPASIRSATSADPHWPYMFWAPNGTECTFQRASCKETDWMGFLKSMRLSELAAPTGGRAYRWLWVNVVPTNIIPEPSPGYVELIVEKDRIGRIRSVWHPAFSSITPSDIAKFEAVLGGTSFATLPEQDENAQNWLDYPPEQLMEAIVGGRYHFVHRVGGIAEPGVRDAGVLLEGFAGAPRS